MAAPESTKFQVNFKLNDGTLVNIYALSSAELEAQLTAIQDTASLITSVSTTLGRSSGAAIVANSFNQSSAPVSSVIEEGNCKHGTLVYRESKPGAPKTWKGWFCPSPQGTADQCAPKFLR
jgi:hypothetical protein